MIRLIIFLSLMFNFAKADAKYLEKAYLHGEGVLTWLGFQVYTVKLWKTSKGKLYDHPLVLELTYNLEIPSNKIVDKSISEMRDQGVSIEIIEDLKVQFEKIFPDVKPDDSIACVFIPGSGARFYHNKVYLGQIKDDKSAQLFLDIWLGDKTSEKSLRKKLLGDKL